MAPHSVSKSVLPGLLLVLALAGVTQPAEADVSAVSKARWLRAQAPYLYNQGVGLGYNNSAGVTLFPQGQAVTVPNGCTHIGGSPPGYNEFPNVTVHMTEYVGRWRHPTLGNIFGKASADNCGPCNNTCPCNLSEGRSFGYFPEPNASPYGFGDTNDHYGFEATAQQFDYPFSSNWSYPQDTFDILLQPETSDGFEYAWVPLSEAVNSSETFQIEGNAPCCIPLSEDDRDNIYSDNHNTSWVWYDSSFRPTGENITGSLMGTCNLAAQEAAFTWYAFAYRHVPGDAEPMVLITRSTSSGSASALTANAQAVFSAPNAILQPLPLGGSSSNFQPMNFTANWTSATELVSAFPANYALANQCRSTVTTGNNESSTYVPAWYSGGAINGTDVPAPWAIAALQPAKISILLYNTQGPNIFGDYSYDYTFAPSGETASQTSEDGHFLFQLNGLTPCCIASMVPSTNETDDMVSVGDVIGWCDPVQHTAAITWLGRTVQQDFDDARMLNVVLTRLPGPDYSGLIAGVVIGGVAAIALTAILLYSMRWSARSYRFRSYKRLIEDHVHTLVLGLRSEHMLPYGSKRKGDAADEIDVEDGTRVALANDRFFNLLPFVNRMPRNQFYANLSSSVAHGCLDSWTGFRGTHPKKMNHGVLDHRFDGKSAQALAYAILKHESLWSATDRAIVQQWPKGSKGRRRIIADIEDILSSPDTTDFLEGLDQEPLYADEINSRGCWTMLARLLCCALPPHRISNKEFTDGTSAYDSTNDDALTGDSSYMTGDSDAFSQRKQPADILSGILKELQLSDWEIRAAELEIMKHPDGSNVVLGAGAFGQVFKAKWNGVQTVAVKQLIQSTSDKAKTDFLREVAILKKLRAENVVRFLGVSADQEQTQLVTEFMAGGDLFHAMQSDRRRSEFNWYNTGRRVALDVARGLAFLHSQQIVHFDMKSPNILLARDLTAKIADVGLAKIMQNDLFTNVSAIGTMSWAAPELLTGMGDVSAKVDVYSEGVVLWEIVTQETPRFGTSWWRAPRIPEECPQWVADLIEQCMSPDPSKRPTSREVYQRLQSGAQTNLQQQESM
ncbi:hypothetical protein WJX73_002438 [Symbiochloris irregularis]|uniref:Protein kinase domain-containing protein n=1 Tax=Symbiochloris irregularis TaxID=706552 RepID=A0AAW1P0H3_9CHLO